MNKDEGSEVNLPAHGICLQNSLFLRTPQTVTPPGLIMYAAHCASLKIPQVADVTTTLNH
jgi:hypothetical protein